MGTHDALLEKIKEAEKTRKEAIEILKDMDDETLDELGRRTDYPLRIQVRLYPLEIPLSRLLKVLRYYYKT